MYSVFCLIQRKSHGFLMRFRYMFDALLMRFLAALHKPYLRLHPVNFTWSWLHALSFLSLIKNSYFPNQILITFRYIFDAFLMHFWCIFDALLMHFWCTFGALLMHFSKVHQNVLKVHQKCIKFKSASKVYNQFWYSSSKFLQNLMANSWMLAATKLDQEHMKSARVFP